MGQKEALCWVIAGGVFALTLVFERVQATATAARITQAHGRIAIVKARNEHLRFRVQELKSPAYLQTEAERRLAMSIPGPERVFTLEDSLPQRTSQHGWLARLFTRDSADR